MKPETVGKKEQTAIADSAMATGTDDEPDMTIADKFTGEPMPDPDGDGVLTTTEAAALLGDDLAAKQEPEK